MVSCFRGFFFFLTLRSFGPVCLNTEAAEYGCITTTPKPGWKGARVVAHFEDLAGRVVFETDVNAPALLEASEAGLGELCYVTVGTGVGVGAVVRGHCLHGHSHPEAGEGICAAAMCGAF